MLKKLFEEKEIKYFIVIAMVIGIIMSFLISPWQVPDEFTHLNLIGYSIGNNDYASKLEASLGMDQGRVEWNSEQATSMEQIHSAIVKKPDYHIREMGINGLALDVIKYIPAIIGMQLAIVLQLPTFWVLQFGELFSLITYVLICAVSLKVCPFKKNIMAIFMLAPMMMQQAGSLTHDALVIPLMFFIICYVLHLRFEKEEISLKDIVLLVVAWLWVTLLKMPYVVIVLIGLMLPLKKLHIKIGKYEIDEAFIKKVRWPVLLLLAIIMVCVVYVLRDNRWILVLYGVVMEWPRTLQLIWNTIQTFTGHLLVSSVGNFGWLNAPVSDLFAVAFYVVLFIIALIGTDGSKKRMNKWDRSVVWVTFIALTLMTLFSMINHTIMITLFGSESSSEMYEIRSALYQIPYIGGLQGRYFMPFVSLFFMQFGSLEVLSEKKTKIFTSLFMGVTYLYIGYILIDRFWIG